MGMLRTIEVSMQSARMTAWPASEVPTSGGPANGTTNTPETRRAAKVSAAKALVAIRRRTGRADPADVLQLAQQD